MVISIAFAGRCAVVRTSGREFVAPLPESDSDEAWVAFFREALRSVRARGGPAVVGLSGEQLVVLAAGAGPSPEVLVEAARLLQKPVEEVVVASSGPAVCAVPASLLRDVARRLRGAGCRPVRIDSTGAALVRSVADQGVVLIGYITPAGCEIAAGSRSGLVTSRAVPAEEAATELLRTYDYLIRVGQAPSSTLIGGGPRETCVRIAEVLRSRGIDVQLKTRVGDLPFGDVLAVPGTPGFAFPIPEAPRLPLARIAAAAALASILSVGVAARWQIAAVEGEVARLKAMQEMLAREIRLRKPSPAVVRTLESVKKDRVRSDPFETVRKVIPERVWLEQMRVDGRRVVLDGKAVGVLDVWEYALALGGRVTGLRFLEPVLVGGKEARLFSFTIEKEEPPRKSSPGVEAEGGKER